MSCSPAPVVLQYGRDVADRFKIPTTYNQPGPGGVFLGSVGDQAHAVRTSSHNCAPMQESSVNGVSYAGQYAHAWDARPVDKLTGERMAAETLADPRVRYVIYDNVGRKANGERWETDHPTFHVSFLPGTHADIRPFFTTQSNDFTEAEVKEIVQAIDRLGATIVRRSKLEVATTQRQHALDRRQQAKLAKDDDAYLAADLELEEAVAVIAANEDD